MSTPQEKLAQSLDALKALQDQGFTAIKTSELSRVHRERLINNGFIRQIIQGWYIIVTHNEKKVDTTVRLQTNLNWPSPKLSHSFNF